MFALETCATFLKLIHFIIWMIPFRKRKASRSTKRSTKKARVLRVVSAAPSFPSAQSNPMAPHMKVKMNYVQVKNISIAGPRGLILFRCASIFDPDFSGTGHQPLGHDQWATFYQRYRVYGMSYEIRATNDDAVNSVAFFTAISETSSPGTGLEEHESAQFRVMGAGQQEEKVIKGYVDLAKFEGDPGAKYDKDYSANFGSNPTREIFLAVGGLNTFSASDVSLQMLVKLTYYVNLYDRVDLSQS